MRTRQRPLRLADRDKMTQSLSFALRFNGRKRVHDADEVMARITAERLVEHLERSGYAVMCKPPAASRPGHRRPTINPAPRRPPARARCSAARSAPVPAPAA